MKHILFIVIIITCIGCKARKVLTTRIDSNVTLIKHQTVHSDDTHVDTSKVKTEKSITEYDSSGLEIVIVPLSGKNVSIDKDGNFTGEASKVEITNKKYISIHQIENTNKQIGVNNHEIINSISDKNQLTTLSKKIKDIASKPDYSWIWWLAGFVAFVFVAWRIYSKANQLI